MTVALMAALKVEMRVGHSVACLAETMAALTVALKAASMVVHSAA